jgi:ribonuclease HII
MARGDSGSCSFALEEEAHRSGLAVVAGIDEAGRGPWAGPVAAAAVILDPRRIPRGIADSKTLSEARREALYAEITATADVGIAMAEVARIDRDNILNATLWAMAKAVARLPLAPAFCLVDGNRLPHLPMPARAVVAGDAISLSIAAASIVAKVARDRLMRRLDRSLPGYGFARHKGYGTAFHAEALKRLGPSPEHRRSFQPVRALLDQSR